MAIRRCDAGLHTYDTEQHTSCPYCRKTRLTVSPGGSIGDMPPVDAPKMTARKTVPANAYDDSVQVPPSVQPPNFAAPSSNKTRIVIGGSSQGNEESKTIDFGEIMPVVAWLVIVNGKGQGHDLRVTPGMNSIGRERGDIVLDFGEGSVSREKHAFIAYDSDENQFMIAHGEGKNLTKVNGKMVMGQQELQAYDRISIGTTELMFVPLCGGDFSWNDVA